VGAPPALYEKKVRRVGALKNQGRIDAHPWFFFVAAATAPLICIPTHQLAAQSPASPTTWAVTVAPDSRCADDADFASELGAQVPEAQRAPSDRAELVAEVRLRRDEKELIGEIRVRDRVLGSEAGARELRLPLADCAETAEALGLVLSVLVEAGRGARPETPAPEPPPEPPPEPRPEPEQPKPAAPRPPARYAWQGPRAGHDLHLGFGVGYGLMPGAYFGGNLAWGLRVHDTWPVWFELAAFLPSSTDDGRAEFTSLYAGVFPCPLRLETGRLRGRLCPGFSAGFMRAEGRGFAQARASTQVVAMLGLEASGDVSLWGPLTAFLRIRPEVPLLRERFIYYQADGATPQLHQPAPVTLVAFLGMGLRFR
jgi:hypothetical protein